MLLLFFASFAGMYSWLQLQKYRARKEAKAFVITTHAARFVEVLTYPVGEVPEAIRWIHEDEFELNGILYDVLRLEERNDSVFLQIWEDSKETVLNRQIKSLTNRLVQAGSETSRDEARWVQFLNQLMPASEVWRFHGRTEFQDHQATTNEEYAVVLNAAPPSPPPETAGFKG